MLRSRAAVAVCLILPLGCSLIVPSDAGLWVQGELHLLGEGEMNSIAECRIELVSGIDGTTLDEADIPEAAPSARSENVRFNELFIVSPRLTKFRIRVECSGYERHETDVYDFRSNGYYEEPLDLQLIRLGALVQADLR